MASQDQPESSRAGATRKKRERCENREIWKILFELFQHQDEGGQNYILTTNEIWKGRKKTYHLSLVKTEEKWVVTVKKTSSHSNLNPVSQITNSPVEPEYPLSLQERLKGWIVEKRARNTTCTGAWDKYYYHESDPQSFRSLIEVAIFLLYSCRRDHLENAMDMFTNEENVQLFPHEAHCDSRKSHVEREKEGHMSNADVSIYSEIGIKTEEIPQEKGNEKSKNVDAEEDEIFAWVLANPIVDLDFLDNCFFF
ncbi:hypothetical protein CDL12_21739 [Handroanthus impetiginosus]|uniref:Uncharacterized protein n=1 Tax=Handroanthus impetiginosus TaxID=429701 RepID=A0A2G9GL21_9LAMI|nr:hypothetical protein CDL12_21739 [Handroanthus impetiginosus]